jgi:hypothetical protein
MTNFNYTWKVVQATEENKHMLVEYSLEGYTTHLVGMPMPTEAVTLEQRVQQYAPIALWEFAMIAPVSVQVGTTGSSSFTVTEPFSNNVVPSLVQE